MKSWSCLTAAIAALITLATEAHANMPALTPHPSKANVAACEKWASSQDEEAIYMWGTLQSGGSSNAVGVGRLTATCLGDPKPDIVGFGSSVGFDDAYCKKNPKHKICNKKPQ